MSGSEDLLRIVGAERGAHPAETVAAAEAELRKRLGAAQREAVDRLRTAARAATVFGLACVAVPLLVLQDTMGPPPDVGFVAQAWVQGALGIVLAAGGIGLWRRRAWGRQCVLFVLWCCVLFVVGFSGHAAISMASGASILFRVALGAMVLLNGALWLFLLHRGRRYLSDPRILALLQPRAEVKAA
jgi:hypothetical protein